MVRHVILWKLKEEYTEKEKEEIKEAAKTTLENLTKKVPTVRAISLVTSPLPSSNCDMMLDALFDNEEGLKEYSTHPLHVEAANTTVRPYVQSRVCFDFEC